MWLIWPSVTAGALAAVYSGFLFGQAEARDFWQTPLLPVHLLVQAVAAGAGILLVAAPLVAPGLIAMLSAILAGALVVHLLLVAAEIVVPHANLMVAQTAELITRGSYARRFWWLAVGAGGAVPLALLTANAPASSGVPGVVAGMLTLVGLLVYEDIWVRAGQAVPLS
jgi:formate-dependent nitrite reductase membrane component NrfD